MEEKQTLLPHNLEAEKSLLSCLFFDSTLTSLCISNNLKRESFYSISYGYIYDAIVQVFYSQQKIDPITVGDEMLKNKTLDTIGGQDFLFMLAGETLTTSGFIDYLKIVLEKKRLRDVASAMERFRAMALAQGDSEKILGQLRTSVFTYLNSGLEDSGGRLDDVYSQLLTDMESGEAVDICSTGYTALDAKAGGFKKTHVRVVGATTGMGKSTVCLNFLVNAALQGVKSCIFSMEVSRQEITQKVLCRMSGIPSDAFKERPLRSDVLQKVHDTDSSMRSIFDKLFVYDKMNRIDDINSQIYSLAGQGVQLFVVDHLLLIRGNKRMDSKHYEIADYVNGFKAVAQELGVCIILVSQFNRKVDNEIVKEPKLSYFSGSSAIEQIANVAIGVHRPERVEEFVSEEDKNKMDLYILKNRDGADGIVRLGCNMATSSVYNLEGTKRISQGEVANVNNLVDDMEELYEPPF